MILKAIFEGLINFLLFTWKLAKIIITFLGKNMLVIYMWLYFVYGFYLMYDKKLNPLTGKGLDIDYLFIGLWLVALYTMEYTDMKIKALKKTNRLI